MTNSGHGLEVFVYELYNDLGYDDVKINKKVSKNVSGQDIYGQIDLIYSKSSILRVVECKYRTNSNVTFDDYAKFETTLKTFNIPLKNSEMVTNTRFDNKVIACAKAAGIRLIDIEGLNELNNQRFEGYRKFIIMYNFIRYAEEKGLLEAINRYYRRFLPIDLQIQSYS